MPTSKIIQVVHGEGTGGDFFGMVLCEDGTIWQNTKRYGWECIFKSDINDNDT